VGFLVHQANEDKLDQKVNLVQWVSKVYPDLGDSQDPKGNKVYQERQGSQVRMAGLVLKEKEDCLDHQENLANKDLWAYLVNQGCLVLQGLEERKGRLAHQDHKVIFMYLYVIFLCTLTFKMYYSYEMTITY